MSRGTLDTAVSVRLSLTGLSPSLAGFPKAVLLAFPNHFRGPNPGAHAPRFGLLRVRSPLLTESLVVFSSSGYLDVSVRRVPLPALWIGAGMHEGSSCGFPHSDTSGSKGICPSPKLFAAYRVFHRLLVPRHPPCALSCLALPDTIALAPDGLGCCLVFVTLLLFAVFLQRLVFVSIFTFNVF